jgi:hypothetical protein
VRVVYLRTVFHQTRRVYAPPGSPQHNLVRRVLAQLADERFPLPGPDDLEALRCPVEVIWARRVPGTDLVVAYSVLPLMIEVRAVHPDWSASSSR